MEQVVTIVPLEPDVPMKWIFLIIADVAFVAFAKSVTLEPGSRPVTLLAISMIFIIGVNLLIVLKSLAPTVLSEFAD